MDQKKLSVAILVGLGTVIVWVIGSSMVRDAREQRAEEKRAYGTKEGFAEKMERWRTEAGPAAREVCSNEVVGISRIVKVDLRTDGSVPKEWSGEAVVEYVNLVGGIERTNLPIRFITSGAYSDNATHVLAFVDGEKLFKRSMEALRAKSR